MAHSDEQYWQLKTTWLRKIIPAAFKTDQTSAICRAESSCKDTDLVPPSVRRSRLRMWSNWYRYPFMNPQISTISIPPETTTNHPQIPSNVSLVPHQPSEITIQHQPKELFSTYYLSTIHPLTKELHRIAIHPSWINQPLFYINRE